LSCDWHVSCVNEQHAHDLLLLVRHIEMPLLIGLVTQTIALQLT